jgi:hypothetical protein
MRWPIHTKAMRLLQAGKETRPFLANPAREIYPKPLNADVVNRAKQ